MLCPGLSHADIIYKGTVFAFKLNIRSEPSRYADVVATLEKGEELDVVKAEGGIGGWLTVVYKGRTGYVRNRPKYITLSAPPAAPVVVKPKIVKKRRQISKPEPEAKPETQASPKAEKAAIAKKIEDETRKIEGFSQREVEVLDSLNEIDFSLNQARVKSRELTRESRVLTQQIQEIQKEIQEMNDAMSQVRGYAGERLEALYRMHMMGTLEMSGAPSSLYDFYHPEGHEAGGGI